MPLSKITNNGYGLSFASPVENSKDLLLWNIDESLKIQNEYSDALHDVDLLQDIFFPEENFFYKIQCFDSSGPGRKLICSERGVGEINKRYRKFYLKRELTTHYEDPDGERKSRGYLVDFPKDAFIICFSYIPEKFIDLLIYPNSVICSINGRSPTPVELEERTLLGRLDDRIQSIDATELRTILTDENIIDAVETTNKSLSIQSKVVDLVSDNARVSAPIVQARPVYNNSKRPARAQRGSIIYNDQTNCFEGYDGTAWRQLKWGDE